MGWRHDEKQAHKVAETEPEKALALVTGALDAAKESKFSHLFEGHTHEWDLIAFKIELEERLGQTAQAGTDRAALYHEVEDALARLDAGGLAQAKDTMGMRMHLEARSRLLARLGRQEEADRNLLQAADVTLAALGDRGAKAGAAATPFFVLGQGAMGLESGAAFRQGYVDAERGVANGFRDEVVKAGRGVALAWCRKCGGVVEANYKKAKCAPHHHKVDVVRVVVKADEDTVRHELEQGAVAA